MTVYRGTGLTKEELQTYTNKIGTSNKVVLTGFISTSMDRSAAESFVWFNKDTGHEPTLFEIRYKNWANYYVMDMSAFADEQEVLLWDGMKFEVVSVDKIKDKNGAPLNYIVLKNFGHDDEK